MDYKLDIIGTAYFGPYKQNGSPATRVLQTQGTASSTRKGAESCFAFLKQPRLRDQLVQHVTRNVGQPEIASAIAVR